MNNTSPLNESALKQLTTTEHETLIGRLAALEVLVTHSWVHLLGAYPDALRDDFTRDSIAHVEPIVQNLPEVAKSAASTTTEGVILAALATVRMPGRPRQRGIGPSLN